MDVGHRQVVHEELSSVYTDVCVLFMGGGGLVVLIGRWMCEYEISFWENKGAWFGLL